MDTFLLDYLGSGKAWVFVGSGPSIQRGYPSWNKLALSALKIYEQDNPGLRNDQFTKLLNIGDYPRIFNEVSKSIGPQKLLQCLRQEMKPNSPETRIYDLLAQWPIPVYLTTNFDDEIQSRLASIRESYSTFSNDEDNFQFLIPDLQGAIFKLHGDLRSEKGLILTSSQYENILNSPEWEYWRIKMTSILQMNRIIIIGYSITDPHMQFLLKLAKKGTGIIQPICWIAPDISIKDSAKYLEEYRIRVISYDNRDGKHQNLLRLLESINDFVPKRISIPIKRSMESILQTNYQSNSAAPGFFVFNKLFAQNSFSEKRIQVITAAITAVLPKAKDKGLCTLKDILLLAGWPNDNKLPNQLEETILTNISKQGLCTIDENGCIKINDLAISNSNQQLVLYNNLRDRFITSLVLRIKQKFPSLSENAENIANDIDASMVSYFKNGGVTLASTLFSHYKSDLSTLPSSMAKFIQEASNKYDDILLRQAFFTISVDIFTQSTSADREYLGRIAQGFIAFHMLGAFGDVAEERYNSAKNTVWIVDSSLQIHCIALASLSNAIIRESITRLREMGIRFFTTYKLFEETIEHLWFANNIVREYGHTSYYVFAAAKGDAPFKKSNVFLDGFIRWQLIEKKGDWESYLFSIFNAQIFLQNSYFSANDKRVVQGVLKNIGIEVIDIIDWPGYDDSDTSIIEENKIKIIEKIVDYQQILQNQSINEHVSNPVDKATPEAEALMVINKERSGEYHIISDSGEISPSWFISDTSMLNFFSNSLRITWPSISFINFANSLFSNMKDGSVDRSFETLVYELSRSGINLLDDRIIETVFSNVIDQTKINLLEQRGIYERTLSEKYGEDPELLISRMSSIYRPMAIIQLLSEMAVNATENENTAKEQLQKSQAREKQAITDLRKVEKYRNRVLRKENELIIKKRKKKK